MIILIHKTYDNINTVTFNNIFVVFVVIIYETGINISSKFNITIIVGELNLNQMSYEKYTYSQVSSTCRLEKYL